jgi:cytidylate kinase
MVAARDAVEVATDGLSPAEVLDRLAALVREKMPS